MPPSTPRLRILSVGGNAVSAFLSWRLSATNACDVTLVWKSGFEAVAQYGISFKSAKFGNERFKPRHVVRSPEEAAGLSRASYDYVILCVKALPDVYDLASVIESVVAPQHTCILVNTTSSLGIETYLEQRFPTNVVLSLVSGAELAQISSSEFEHKGSSELWVGAANKNPAIPASIQQDMAEALSMTLKSGSVECEVSQNIRQQQYERMVGPIAFHPASVLFETPSHSELLEKPGVRQMITGIMDEAINLAQKQGCAFSSSFKQQTLEQMLAPADSNSIMYQDFIARRPMEVETFLGSPLKQAQELGMALPRIETLYALLHNINVINQSRPQPSAAQPVSPAVPQQPPPRMSSAPNGGMPKGGMYGPGPMARPPMGNGMRPGSRAPSAQGGPPPGRRGPSMNGYPRMSSNGYGQRGPPPPTHRRPSFEGNDLEEFSHLILYDNHDDAAGYDNMPSANGDLALRERELAIRQKELALREQEYSMRRRGPGRMQSNGYDDDDEEGEDYFDAVATHPPVDENFDMMSVTSRRTRKTPSATQLRANPEMMGMPPSARNSRGWRPQRASKNRASASIMADMPGLREELMGNPLVGYSSDRYATVDRMNMGNESRTNSLTMERLNDIHRNGMQGPYPGQPPMSRRGSQSPGNPLGPNGRQMRPSPPNGYAGPPPPPHNGRPSDPNMRQPVPRHPPGHGNNISPQDVENQAGVSSRNPYPPKSGSHVVRSLTGSASASQGSGDSNRSAPLDSSEPSAHSSSSSLQVRQSIGVR